MTVTVNLAYPISTVQAWTEYLASTKLEDLPLKGQLT